MLKKIFLIVIILISVSISQTKSGEEVNFSGNLKEDSKLISKLNYSFNEEERNLLNLAMLQNDSKKKPFLAGIMSLVVPGAGEIYAEDYLKGAAFFLLEAAAITTAIIYDGKGDDQTNTFENFADDNWSVEKYANWLWNNREALGIPNDHGITNINEIVIHPGDPNYTYWQRVDFSKLNKLEVRFSHRLPSHGDQQYYEMIGKYPQFNHGWVDQTNDATPMYNENLTVMFLDYSRMRGKANDYYNVASKAVIVLYVNHFLSALDAVWSAVSFNKNLAFNFRVSEEYYAEKIEIIPRMNISFNF